MSSVTQSRETPATPPPPPDEFRYGWRDVRMQRPDGTIEFRQIPLTLQDVLHPQQGDVILESTLHDLVRTYLADVFRAWIYRDPTALVTSDTGIYWDDPELGHHCPDVGVIFGVQDRGRNRPSFFVATEKTRPRLLTEIVSPNTRSVDVVDKFAQYHQARVPYCVILDRLRDDAPWQLHGYQYDPAGYVEMAKDERGRLWLPDIGVWLGTDGQRVICYDGATDAPIGDYVMVTRELQASQERIAAEQARAASEQARASAEAAARQQAETRLRELEAELTRLRGTPPN